MPPQLIPVGATVSRGLRPGAVGSSAVTRVAVSSSSANCSCLAALGLSGGRLFGQADGPLPTPPPLALCDSWPRPGASKLSTWCGGGRWWRS